MSHVDEDLLLTRARLAVDAMAVGTALLNTDVEEARFRTHLVLKYALEAGFEDVAHAARGMAWLMKDSPTVAVPGIGRALLRLTDAIDAGA
ncbi:hypothetical protein L2Y96_12920 [Luteibacter aegosomaticola]|uniref:hypothetical protein n=1 Tax=Luteibacter aegosomaticola TaxID=2911538 RepID=UPI001FF9BAB1|nr:hypothetical protein [Luteibacter aegosomaticola]UPG88323.1 hypothetical protein L2Y96_12920 [Luteibacter aegosomaticola]